MSKALTENRGQDEGFGRWFYILIALLLVALIPSAIISSSIFEYQILNVIFSIMGVATFLVLVYAIGTIIEWWWNDAKKDGKPSDTLLCIAGSILLIPIWFLIVTPAVFIGMEWVACDIVQISDKYHSDSPCFDFHYRCVAECSSYGLNFTGVTDGCACDCGTGWVSSCSGFYYDKDPEGQDLIMIVGDEVVEYPNGTIEPAGYEPGVYAFNKSEPMVIDEEHKVGEL